MSVHKTIFRTAITELEVSAIQNFSQSYDSSKRSVLAISFNVLVHVLNLLILYIKSVLVMVAKWHFSTNLTNNTLGQFFKIRACDPKHMWLEDNYVIHES